MAAAAHRPAVVALHASASSSKQWRALAKRLDGLFRFSALDHIAHGEAPAWAGRGQPGMSDHVQRLARHIGASAPAVHLVAHSFGAVVALQFALDHPARVRSLMLYEPVLLSLLAGRADLTDPERDVHIVADRVRHAVACGRPAQAAQTFIDYWSDGPAWAGLDARQQAALAAHMPAVAGHFDVIECAHSLAQRLPEIRTPTLLLSGSCTTPSARRVAALLGAALPRAYGVEIAGAGHMGPLTQADDVNEQIADFVLAEPVLPSFFPLNRLQTKAGAASSLISTTL